jgi:hypothetical protein
MSDLQVKVSENNRVLKLLTLEDFASLRFRVEVSENPSKSILELKEKGYVTPMLITDRESALQVIHAFEKLALTPNPPFAVPFFISDIAKLGILENRFLTFLSKCHFNIHLISSVLLNSNFYEENLLLQLKEIERLNKLTVIDRLRKELKMPPLSLYDKAFGNFSFPDEK